MLYLMEVGRTSPRDAAIAAPLVGDEEAIALDDVARDFASAPGAGAAEHARRSTRSSAALHELARRAVGGRDHLVLRMAVREWLASPRRRRPSCSTRRIELARAFSGDAARFVNGVLDGAPPPPRRRQDPRIASSLMSNEAEQIGNARPTWTRIERLGDRAYPHSSIPPDRVGDVKRHTAIARARSSRAERVDRWPPVASSACAASARRASWCCQTAAAPAGLPARRTRCRRDFEIYKLLDLGDHVGVTGHLFRTKTNELTIWAVAARRSSPSASCRCRRSGTA